MDYITEKGDWKGFKKSLEGPITTESVLKGKVSGVPILFRRIIIFLSIQHTKSQISSNKCSALLRHQNWKKYRRVNDTHNTCNIHVQLYIVNPMVELIEIDFISVGRPPG